MDRKTILKYRYVTIQPYYTYRELDSLMFKFEILSYTYINVGTFVGIFYFLRIYFVCFQWFIATLRHPLSPPNLISTGLYRSAKGLNLKGLSLFFTPVHYGAVQ